MSLVRLYFSNFDKQISIMKRKIESIFDEHFDYTFEKYNDECLKLSMKKKNTDIVVDSVTYNQIILDNDSRVFQPHFDNDEVKPQLDNIVNNIKNYF